MNTRIRAATFSSAIALALLCASNVPAAETTVARRAPAETTPISQSTPGSPDRVVLLAIDDVSLPFRKNVCLYLSKPTVRAEPVLAPSPWTAMRRTTWRRISTAPCCTTRASSACGTTPVIGA